MKAKKSQRKTGKKQNLIQSTLQVNGGSKSNKLVKCDKCEMSYSSTSIEDRAIHEKYHALQLHGRKWSPNWGSIAYTKRDHSSTMHLSRSMGTMTPLNSSPLKNGSSIVHQEEKIVSVRPDKSNGEVRAMMEIMTLVNNELNAPHDENDIWNSTTEEKGKAFVYIRNDRAIGIIIIENLHGGNGKASDRGRWMVYDSRRLVQNVYPDFKIGISRIWVCRTARNLGIATKLIDIARENIIYGEVVPRSQVAWSQPTDSGGKLASKYNGVMHKSGKLLLPVYI
ncbi:Eco1p [Saccharomyces eubayanus]|uniref:Eco1p n=1 Tax=Saccharomyces eubayanus TaxID=1080349 RepID=UPI0006BF66EB|nr:ECO1-like protein [Saccharomyces eubayanus]KOG99843.1 ECO1-like protein [Saccharomyces eubayanus]